MSILENRAYAPDSSVSDTALDDYFNKTDTFGHFTEDGRTYVVERRDTPRPWLHFLCNEKVYACIGNVGEGFFHHVSGHHITKQWERRWYYTHEPCGRRVIIFEIDGKKYDFFLEAEDFAEYVSVGSVCFKGRLAELAVELTVFVPEKLPCECMKLNISSDTKKDIKIIAEQEYMFHGLGVNPDEHIIAERDGENTVWTSRVGMTACFAMSGCEYAEYGTHEEQSNDRTANKYEIVSVRLERNVTVGGETDIYFVSGADRTREGCEETLACLNAEVYASEFEKMSTAWEKLLRRNTCKTPNANFDLFANYWLKNQLQLTYYYDRGSIFVGYRDGLQDAWGYMMLSPEIAKDKLIATLAHMLPDGRCPRQFYRWADRDHDMRDFSDSITWVGLAMSSYIKETGDFSILDEKIGFLGGDEITTVEDHLLRGFESLYTLRGDNGLILMRRGDWLDGLEGMDQYGEATSVWVTIAAYYAQNLLAEIFERVGKNEIAEMLRARSAEYRETVRRVGWDGNWYVYAFHGDGEPVGGSQNLEGKIHCNAQTWAILSGLEDDPVRIRKMEKAMNRYLQTPFGPMLLYPPYVFHGERAGRLQRQRPGTYANGAVYNHAAGFKVFADIKRGDYDDALDTFMRALPNHPDNSDRCRTGEPYAVGNVYYGINHKRMGMNLFTWWTATVAWLVHGAFEEILGVKADFDGITIEPHVPDEWNEYSVTKIWRGTEYKISLARSNDEKGIWLDGVRKSGNKIRSENKTAEVLVKF